MPAYAYVLNSPYSDSNIDVESTNWQCYHIVNGVATVCYYYYNLPPGSYVAFPVQSIGENGLHAQASPSGSPSGAWDLSSSIITVNSVNNEIAIEDWNDPPALAATAGGARLKKVERRKPQKNRGEKGPDPRTADAGA